jgi:quercetin dioxygenase-like cupin family protein
MKIRVRDHVKVAADKMAKISLSSTSRTQLDLYCVAPGQSQSAHRHEGEDKIYYVIEGTGRFSVGGAEERLEAGEAVVAPAGVDHGLVNDGAALLLILVLVAPPPEHMKRPSSSAPSR